MKKGISTVYVVVRTHPIVANNVIGTMAPDSIFTIYEEAIDKDGYTWYRIWPGKTKKGYWVENLWIRTEEQLTEWHPKLLKGKRGEK